MANIMRKEGDPTVIKKYANRRLYDTGRSSYVTLEDLCEMVKEGHNFVVKDAKTNEDITHSVLTQIIFEQENKGEENLLPTSFLRNLISFYGDSVQHVVPNYLETTLNIFVENQERIRVQINNSHPTPSEAAPSLPSAIEELNRRNLDMFERAMRMATPPKTTSDFSREDE